MRALLRHRGDKRALQALDERLELVRAGLTRRDLVRMGLMTGGGVGGGLLLSDKALAASQRAPAALGSLPPLAPFVQPLTILPRLPDRTKAELTPEPTGDPNRATNPATGLPFEGRTEPHQSEDVFPVQKYHQTYMGANPNSRPHPGLPAADVLGVQPGRVGRPDGRPADVARAGDRLQPPRGDAHPPPQCAAAARAERRVRRP